MSNKDLTTVENDTPAVIVERAIDPTHPAAMLALAVEKGADITQIQAFMDLQERWDKEQARKAFFVAYSKFQSEVPIVLKSKAGHNSKYAPIGAIVSQVRGAMAAAELSYRFEYSEDLKNSTLTVTCIASHILGHQERTSQSGPLDTSGSKNSIQAIGSSTTYLERYTLKGAFGITVADEDDDGVATDPTKDPAILFDALMRHNAVLATNMPSVIVIKDAIFNDNLSEAKEAWNELEEDEQRALWVAPSKGGILTTAERATMKSNEWGAA